MKLLGKTTFPFVRQPDSMDCGPACLNRITDTKCIIVVSR